MVRRIPNSSKSGLNNTDLLILDFLFLLIMPKFLKIVLFYLNNFIGLEQFTLPI